MLTCVYFWEKVRAVEDQYRSIYSVEGVPGDVSLPESYPTSCLLGCVEVVDCVPQVRMADVCACSELSCAIYMSW